MKWGCLLLLFSSPAWASSLSSPIPSSISSIDLPNTHLVFQDEGSILRSMAPRGSKDYRQLLDYGVTDVIVFKNDTRGEVKREIKKLLALGISDKRIHHIPFVWKGLETFEKPCRQALKAIHLLKKISGKKKRKALLHCTVGEDRTGYLSGLFQMIMEGRTTEQVFQEEMCEKGYAAGNSRKPVGRVVEPIREGLTKHFLKMAYKVERGYLSKDSLSYRQCLIDPAFSKDFREDVRFQEKKYRCKTSSRLKK